MTTTDLTSSVTTATIEGQSCKVVEFDMPANDAFLYVNRTDVNANGDKVMFHSKLNTNNVAYCCDFQAFLPGNCDFTLQYCAGIRVRFASVTNISKVVLAY